MRFRYNLDMHFCSHSWLVCPFGWFVQLGKGWKGRICGLSRRLFFISIFFWGDGVPTYPTSLGRWTGRCQNVNVQLHVKNLLTLGFFAANAWWDKTCTFWFLTCPVSSLYVYTKSLGELRVAQKHQIPSLVSTFLWRRGVSYVIWRKSIKPMGPQDLCHRYLV